MVNIEKIKKIFILGIKGVAMTNLAVIFKKAGKEVFGWDVGEEFITDTLLRKYKIDVFTNRDKKKLINLIKEAELVIYSAAHGGLTHPLLKNIDKKIPCLHQAEIIGILMRKFRHPIAVCGSHGKTTTSSLLSFALIKLNQKPSYIVGTSQFNECDGGDFYPPTDTDYFIAEADEYALNPPYNKTPKFYFLNPKLIIATNIDFDHPDVYCNLNEVKTAFKNFFDKKNLIVCGDDTNLLSILKETSKANYFTYGFNSSNDYQITHYQLNNDHSFFSVKFPSQQIYQFKIKIPGKMNILNTTAVIVTLDQFGFPPDQIAKSINDFSGAKRRFERIYQDEMIAIFDDYAHHPREIAATLEAARLRFPKKRIIVIFQPHTFSRTQALLNEFNKALSKADIAFVLPIFPSARENPKNFSITSEDIIRISNNKKNLFFASDKYLLFNTLKRILKKDDIIFTMGAGDVYKLGKEIPKIFYDYRKK